jgi:YVTN family beta-propeller protein
VVATISGPTGSIAITPNGAFAYVTSNSLDTTISVIDTSTNTVVATPTVGTSPFGVAITPNGAFAYVANFASDDVSVLATASNTVVNTVPVGSNPKGVAVTPDGTFVYVANSSINTVSVISTATNTVTATISVGASPAFIAIRTQGPTGIDQCKNGGWKTFTDPAFKNQGDCVSFVNRMRHQHH